MEKGGLSCENKKHLAEAVYCLSWRGRAGRNGLHQNMRKGEGTDPDMDNVLSGHDAYNRAEIGRQKSSAVRGFEKEIREFFVASEN